MSANAVRVVWTGALALCVFGPIGMVVIAGPGDPSSIWDGLAVVTGTQAAAVIVFVVAFASRVRAVTRVFGIDDMVAVHRFLGTFSLLLVLAHLLVVIIDDPAHVWLLNGIEAPARAAAGLAALVALGGLVGLAQLRQRLGYETWRRWHLLLAALAVTMTALHILWLARLIYDPRWRAVFVALTVVVLGAWALRWLWRPLAGARGWQVVDMRPLGERASAVVLRPLAGHRWAFRPGQFAWLRLAGSPLAEDHPFSMSSAPGRTVEFCISHRGDWTSGPLAELRPGRRVWLDGPHGSVTLDRARSGPIIMVATGVGIAPMLSMLRTMAATQDYRTVRLIVPPLYLYPDEIAQLSRRLRLDVFASLTREITPERMAAYLPSDRDCDVFVCGSPRLVEDVTAALAALAFPTDRVHAERFGLAAEVERAAR